MLKIFYGRENVDKEKFVLEELKRAGRGLLIVPDQFTLEAEQSLFEKLGVDAIMDIEVISLSRLGYRLLEELGGSKRTFIDKYGRHMLLSQIAKEQKEDLRVFRGLESKNTFIDMVNNFISELKQYNCGTDELREIASAVDQDSYLEKKLSDIIKIYSDYEERIKGKYTDSEDYIDLFIGKISRSSLISQNHIWIYGFDSFAPKALSVIGEMMSYARDVNVVLTYTKERSRDQELFQLTAVVLENLKKLAAARGIKCTEEELQKEQWPLNKEKKLSFIEEEIFSVPSKTYPGAEEDKDKDKEPSLTLVAAANIYNEAESAASYVLHLVRDLGYKYKDIKVICNDQDVRGPILKRIFEEYGMELLSDSSKDILQSPVVQYILSLMDASIEKFRTDIVLKVLKTGFGRVSADEIVELDNYAYKYRIKGTMWLKPFIKGEKEYGPGGLKYLNDLRQKAIEPMVGFKEIVKAETTGKFVAAIYDYLYNVENLPEKILSFMAEQEKEGRLDLSDETGQIWGKIVGILDQMAEVMSEDKFDLREFRELFAMGISQVKIGVLPQAQDGLSMGTMQRTRTAAVKALVVVGANEGILPKEKPSAGLLGGDEKELFKEKGVEICKVDSIRLLEERLGIYRNLAKPSERLWLSYSAADTEGNSLKPSNIFIKLTELFPQLKVERDVLNQSDDSNLVNGNISGLRHLTEALHRVAEGEELSPAWSQTLGWYELNQPEKLILIKKGLSFTNKQEELGKKTAMQLYKAQGSDDLSLSPSRVEKFSRCPFSHFIAYGLKPDERRIYEVAPREIGDVYHKCLMRLSESLTTEGTEITAPASRWMTITEEECRDFVDQIISEEVKGYKEGVFQLGNQEKYRSKRLADVCETACWVMIQQVRAGNIVACGFEVPFGRQGKIEPIEVVLIDGEKQQKIYIEGIIDRVDYLTDDHVKIVDYKTGNEDFNSEDAAAGYKLQLMLYLKASEEGKRQPGGVFYFHISQPMINATNKTIDREKIEKEVIRNFKLKGILLDDPGVVKDIAGEFKNHSLIAPLQQTKEALKGNLLTKEAFKELEDKVTDKLVEICSNLVSGNIDVSPMKKNKKSACDYCQYKGICRFDTVLEGCGFRRV